MSAITFPYPNWVRTFGYFLIFIWAPFSFFRKYFLFDMIDLEMAMAPLAIGLVMLYFSKEKIDDERIDYLKFRALAFAMINGLILSWLATKFMYNWNYTVKTDLIHPIPATLFIVLTIILAYARLYYLKART